MVTTLVPHLGPLSWVYVGIFVFVLLLMVASKGKSMSDKNIFMKPFYKKNMKSFKLKW